MHSNDKTSSQQQPRAKHQKNRQEKRQAKRKEKRKEKRETKDQSLRRRMKAAGLDDAAIPQQGDEFRYYLARKISMIRNRWHGCPELACARNRGCMTPHGRCSNDPVYTKEEVATWWHANKHLFLKALKASIARKMAEEGRNEDEATTTPLPPAQAGKE